MGQTASAPSTPFLGTPSLRRSKSRKQHAVDSFFTPSPTAPPLPTFSQPRRRSLVRKSRKKQRNETTEAQQFLAEAARDQKEVARLLATAQLEGKPCTPRLVLNEEGNDALEGLAIRVGGRKFSRDEPVLPPLELHETLEVLHEQFRRASVAQSAPLARTKSAPSRSSTYDPDLLSAPPVPHRQRRHHAASDASGSPRASPVSHWSESSVGPSPMPPFESFRNSLNLSQLNRLSAVLSVPAASSSSSSPTPLEPLPVTASAPTTPSSRSSRIASVFSGKRKKRSTIREKGPIVVVGAERIGSGRYSMLKDAAEAAATTRRLSEAERKASLSASAAQQRGRKASQTSLDVWDSAIPLPGKVASPIPSPMMALSPRFSTTPAALSSLYRTAPEDVRADAQRLNRTSWIMLDPHAPMSERWRDSVHLADLASFIAASPELTCGSSDGAAFASVHAKSVATHVTPAPTPIASRLPAHHPASYHSRFARSTPTSSRRASTSSLLPVPRPQPANRRRSSLHVSSVYDEIAVPSSPRARRRSGYRVSVADIDEESPAPSLHQRRASAISIATTTNSADQAVVSRAIAVRRRSRLGSVAETAYSHFAASTPGSEFPLPLARPDTLYSQHSGLSFPRSVRDDADSPFASPMELPARDAGSYGFEGYSLATRSRASLADSISPETVDAFPPPPALGFPTRAPPPAPLTFTSGLHRAIETSSASPTIADTPSTASFSSSSLTSNDSVDLLTVPENILQVDFAGAAFAGQTYSKEVKEASPALSGGSLATFVLEDLLNELSGGDGWEPVMAGEVSLALPTVEIAPLRPKGRLSLEQPEFLPLHLSVPAPPLPTPRSPPRFLSSFSFNPTATATASARKLATQSSPASHPLNDGMFDSPLLGRALPSPGYRFPASPLANAAQVTYDGEPLWTTLPQWTRASAGDALLSAASTAPLESRRGTFPEWVPPSQRGKKRSLFDALFARSALEEEKVLPGREQRLGSADKRGFNKREISDWVANARRESETEAVQVDIRV
ncbi:hypothetical protein JCM10207_005577 [Rhodosporidiobolus poonsookiae]